jgi:hypothetical protein
MKMEKTTKTSIGVGWCAHGLVPPPRVEARRRIPPLVFILLAQFCWLSGAAQTGSGNSIAGQVGAAGIEGATVFLCDAKSGLPLDEKTHQQMTRTNSGEFLRASSDAAGRFCFTNIPPGSYRLVAQSFRGAEPAEKRRRYVSTIPPAENVELHGVAENVEVPSASATNVLIQPLGKGVITFDQNFPNDGGYLLLSTRPVSGDAILGFLGWNKDFVSHLVGVGCVPRGQTLRVSGLPERDIQSVIFVNDNSPGFGATFYGTLPETPQRMPIVAGWSDGQHEPPPRIRHIMNVLGTNNITADTFLQLQKPRGSLQELAQALGPLDRVVVLPNGDKATVADVFACIGYKRLLDAAEARRQKQ